MRILQFIDTKGHRQLGVVHAHTDTVAVLADFQNTYALAQCAIHTQHSLEEVITQSSVIAHIEYAELRQDRRVLPPVDHPDPAHMHITGTGLTHLGSADARDKMHKVKAEALTDSMKMFELGLQGGKPAPGEVGVQPEWFYKGTGHSLVAPYQSLYSPSFALDGGEEPEIVGLYLIGAQGTPYRLGFALGNEFSDHVMERQNYLYLAHSKLRSCAFGPELLLDDLPEDIQGTSRIVREGDIIWEKSFLSGETHMSHSLANLEYHHFKYAQFRHPGDVHAHFFGTATLSFSDDMRLAPGDEMQIEAEGFGQPLCNTFATRPPDTFKIQSLYRR